MTIKTKTPLTIEVDQETLQKIERLKDKRNERSASAVIRAALDDIDLSKIRVSKEEHRQISVRLDPAQRSMLLKVAKEQNSSLGYILRTAVSLMAERELSDG